MKRLSLSSSIELIEPISVRAYTALKIAGVDTIDDLVAAIRTKRLLQVANCGRKTVRELTDFLKKHNLYQEEDAPETIGALRKRVRELETKLDAFNSATDSAFARQVREVCCLLIAKDRERL